MNVLAWDEYINSFLYDFRQKIGNDWSAPGVAEWKRTAVTEQKNIYLMFGGRQWDSYKREEHDLLALKIAYALFGAPVSTI